jgi:large subunit ribosomal protein L4
MTVTMKSLSGADAGSIELDETVFGIQPNVPVMHQVVTAQLAHRRAGTQSTKTRAEVRGGGKKPFRQKGTGNARQGSTRSPQWTGGGVALGPKPRSYAQRTPKKMVRLALRSALSDRAAAGKILVVDEWSFDGPKTREAKAALTALGLDGKIMVVVGPDDDNAILSFRNLPEVRLVTVGELNAYDVLVHEWIVFTKATLPGDNDVSEAAPAAKAPAKKAAAKKAAAPVKKVAAKKAAAAAEADGPYGPGSAAALDDGSAPDGFDIKGNAQSMLYHVPGSRYYEATKAEAWFATEADATAAGFSAPGTGAASHDEEDGQ